MPRGHKLRLKARAERMDDTRLRIVQATYDLHCAIGPGRTTISAIADRAGVQRLTVYHHFRDEHDLTQACTTYGLSLDPPPDLVAWCQVDDPELRLRQALREVYAFFRRNESLFMHIYRDAPVMVERFGGRLPEAVREFMELPRRWRDALIEAPPGVTPSRSFRAALGVAVDYQTWIALVRSQGLSDEEAVDLMVRLVSCTSTSSTTVA